MLKTDQKLTIIAKATEEFLEEVRRSENEPVSEIIRRYSSRFPEIEDNIADLFPALVGVEKMARNFEEAPTDKSEFPVFRDYEIIREIGRGGMGIVYQARQKSLDRLVALKIFGLDPNRRPGLLERFRREAQTAASLHHTNIVPVFEVGIENGVHFFSMQYIDGVNLADLCKYFRATRAHSHFVRTKPDSLNSKNSRDEEATQEFNAAQTSFNSESSDFRTTPKWIHRLAGFGEFVDRIDQNGVARIGAQIADALQYIHETGIVHRDIKPANILLDKNGNAWLADWGLVKSEFSELTQTGDLFGSLAYMAPERFKGSSAAASDIYSLGATLYELVTLQRLFQVEDQAELVNSIVHRAPIQPRAIEPAISRDFETVILKAIDKQPNSRYQSSGKLADDLRNITKGLPVASRRLSVVQKSIRWCKKRPVVATLTLVAILSLLGGTFFSSLFAVQAHQATERAKSATADAEELHRQSEESLDVFFGTFFPQASPDTGAKMSTALRSAMDDAVGMIMDDQSYHPVVVGKLFNRMGWIYFNQQDYQAALRVFTHSHQRVSKHCGQEHVVAMMALDHIGMTLMRMEKHDESERALTKAWILQSKILGSQHENTVHSYAKLGDLYRFTGDFDESIRITREVLKIRLQDGRNDAAFANVSRNGLANAYIQSGQVDEAIKLLEKVIADKESNNRVNLGMAYNLYNLARAYRVQGNLPKAEALCQRSLTMRRDKLVKSSDSVLASRTLLAGINTDQGKLEIANDQFEKIWNDAKSTDLPVRKGMVLLEHGLCLQKMKKHDAALPKLQQAWTVLKKYRSENNIYTAQAKNAIDEIRSISSQ